MRFPRLKTFDHQFKAVDKVRWYPYVGKNFGSFERRVMVYAHNIPISVDHYDSKLAEWTDPAYWADCVEEYTYERGWWTETFRFFVKAAAGLKENYDLDSPPDVIAQVDSLVYEIAYLNFIQDLVKSDSQMANATPRQILVSQSINREFLRILGVTHCICWGKPTYYYIQSMQGAKVTEERCEGKRGFSSCIVDLGFGRPIRLLRIFHPSMPSYFEPFSEETQMIISHFLDRKVVEENVPGKEM